MSVIQRQAILRCVCCEDDEGGGTPPGGGLCYTVAGFEGRYFWGATPASMGLTDHNSDGKIEWGTRSFGDDNDWEGKIKCHKFLVWSPVSITGSTIPAVIGAPRYVLHSRRSFTGPGAGPFHADWPANTVPLSATPYWFSGCGRGGYALTTIAHYPTGAQLNTMWGGSPVPDGNYNLLVGVRAWRRYEGGAPIANIVPVNQGRFRVDYLALQVI